MNARFTSIALAFAALFSVGSPAHAQQKSEGYKFLEAVRDEKGLEVQKMLGEPGTTVINSRDVGSGEGALHIVVKRGDASYLRYLLQQGADPNLRDGEGNTAMLIAANSGQADLVEILIAAKADVNQRNALRNTPIMAAVKRNDLGVARVLMAAGADADAVDSAGRSARDLAHENTRFPAMAKLIDETPVKAKRAVSGPTL